MRLDTTLNQRLEQKLILAPRMIQSMEILQLAIMDLQARIQQELQENPVLELKEVTEDTPSIDEDRFEASANGEDSYDPDSSPLVIDEANGNELDFDRLDAMSKDWGDAFNEEHRPSRGSIEEGGDRKLDAMQNMADRPQSLQEILSDQLGYLDLDPEINDLALFLISHLDENGFLSIRDETDPDRRRRRSPTLEELALSYPDGVVTTAQVEEALRIVQKLEPAGVGARDLKECLLLQVTPDMIHQEILRVLIQHHLEDIQHNRLPVIHRKTGFDIEDIKEAIEELRRLNPRPGASFTTEHVPYVVPDILVEKNDEGEYSVRLLDDWLPSISINRRYIELCRQKGSDPRTREYLKRKIQAAQWLQESIEQRRNTLEKVTKAIIGHQRAFLDKGPEYIEPLKMQQIADLVGVHVTTVSRAVDDKWVQTPRGIFPLKRFFGGGTHTTSGEEVAWETIKQKLLELIGNEDKTDPLSDEALMAKLQEAGYPVARRTITKYRKMLKIPSSRQRKEWTSG